MAFVQTHRLLCFMLAVFMLVCGSLPAMRSSDMTANSMGLRLDVGGSGPGNYTSIQAALDAAQPGDTVYVYDDSSPYYEHLTMRTAGVTLQGEQNMTTVVDGNRTATVVSILAANCSILDLSIRGSGTATLDAGIHVSGASSVIIHGSIVTNASIGILLTDASDRGTISSCTLKDCQTGMSTTFSSSINLTGNILSNDGVGAYCANGEHVRVSWSIFDCKWSGLQLERLVNSSAIKNTIRGSNDGLIAILCTNLILLDNTVTRTRWMNVRIASCIDTQFLGNIIADSDGMGLYISLSQGTIVTQDLFQGNDDGILLEYSNWTQVVGNTFLSLKNDAFVITASLGRHGNRWSHNYWTKPRLLPYPIPGRLKRNGHNFPFISWDFHPLAAPPIQPRQESLSVLSHETLYVGGTGPGNYTSIPAAINNASDGDTIYVYPGQYPGGIILPKALTLQGADPATTIIDSGGYDDGITVIHSDCRIMSFTVCDGHFGVYVRNASNITITSNIIRDNFHGVDLRNATAIDVSSSIIQNNQYGIRLYDSSTVTVTHNSLDNYKLDAYFIGTTKATCSNTWTHNYWSRPRLIALIHGKYFPTGQPATPAWNWDRHPLLRPSSPGFQGKINKQQGGCLAD